MEKLPIDEEAPHNFQLAPIVRNIVLESYGDKFLKFSRNKFLKHYRMKSLKHFWNKILESSTNFIW